MLNKQIGYKFGIAVAVTVAVFALSAYAGGGKETDLQRYAKGRAAAASESTPGETAARNPHDDGRVYVDKGDLGLYVREGVSIKRVYQGEDKPFTKKGSRGDTSGPKVVRMSNGKESREVMVPSN